ncbi:MAG: 23S rRNA (pseudouridine(1915)-N(3))-methyltransferase RlmH [Pseudobdellovibrionaceae bacterium]
MKCTLLACGRIKSGAPEDQLCQDYLKRLGGSVEVIEFESKERDETRRTADEQARLLKAIDEFDGFVIALDERGKTMKSIEFASLLDERALQIGRPILVLIGGACGLGDAVRNRVDLLLGLGKLTWPHKLVRVMILEQLYRASSILAGHPYHRE